MCVCVCLCILLYLFLFAYIGTFLSVEYNIFVLLGYINNVPSLTLYLLRFVQQKYLCICVQ